MYIGYVKKRVEDSLNTTVSDSPSSYSYNRTLSYLTQTPLKNKAVKTTTTLDESQWINKSSAQNCEILLLQIEHLKQENQFLKKKIEEITTSEGREHNKTKIPIQKEKDQLSTKCDSLPMTVSSLIEEIYNLFKSIAQKFTADLMVLGINNFPELIQRHDEKYPEKKMGILASPQLKKSLQKIMTESQANKFQKLVDLFANYYTTKEESDKWLIQSINKMRVKVSQFNKTLTSKKTGSQMKLQKDEMIFQNRNFDFGERQMPMTTKTHQRNKSSITANSQSGLRFFRRTNKPS